MAESNLRLNMDGNFNNYRQSHPMQQSDKDLAENPPQLKGIINYIKLLLDIRLGNIKTN